jgi:hypothetical protein
MGRPIPIQIFVLLHNIDRSRYSPIAVLKWLQERNRAPVSQSTFPVFAPSLPWQKDRSVGHGLKNGSETAFFFYL